MQNTYKDIVSKITNLLKTNNIDDRIPRRFILKVLKDIATEMVSQKLLDRTIADDVNVYTQINCFEFTQIETVKCPNIEFRKCDILMKSINPLPKLVFSRLGASIKEIVSLDGNYTFTFIDKGQYQINKKRRYSLKNQVYIYLGTDNHLYIPDSEIKTLDLILLTMNPEEVKDCNSYKQECKSNWDYEFKCPDKLVNTVYTQALQVLGVNKQIREDQNPNGVQGT